MYICMPTYSFDFAHRACSWILESIYRARDCPFDFDTLSI